MKDEKGCGGCSFLEGQPNTIKRCRLPRWERCPRSPARARPAFEQSVQAFLAGKRKRVQQ